MCTFTYIVHMYMYIICIFLFELFKYAFLNYIAKLYIYWQNMHIYIYIYIYMGKITNIHTQIYMNWVFNKYMGIS